MLSSMSALALFKDSADEKSWEPIINGLAGIVRGLAGSNLDAVLKHMQMIGAAPAYVVISELLYAQPEPRIVPLLKYIFPKAEILLLSSADDSISIAKPMVNDTIRHLAVNRKDDKIGSAALRRTVADILEGREWDPIRHLKPGTQIYSIILGSSDDKEIVISLIEEILAGESESQELLRQKTILIADEMLENALYAAPRALSGDLLYSKGEPRNLKTDEVITFRFGFDGETMVMEVADVWGTLSPETLIKHLSHNVQVGNCPEENGRGLYFIWSFLEHLHVSIIPGEKTVIGGHVTMASALEEFASRGIHISAHKDLQHTRRINDAACFHHGIPQ